MKNPRTAHEVLPGDPDNLKPLATRGRYRTPDGKALIEWKIEQKKTGLNFRPLVNMIAGQVSALTA